MLFDRGRLRACYEDIKAAAKEANGGCSVLLLVAADADAICAARILGVSLLSASWGGTGSRLAAERRGRGGGTVGRGCTAAQTRGRH
jgi:hypothetical protein